MIDGKRELKIVREMSERMIERDERGREIVYVSGKDLPTKFEWSKHMNNCVEEERDGGSDERGKRYDESRNRTQRNNIHYSYQRMV